MAILDTIKSTVGKVVNIGKGIVDTSVDAVEGVINLWKGIIQSYTADPTIDNQIREDHGDFLRSKWLIGSETSETLGDVKRLLPFTDDSVIEKLQRVKNDIEPDYSAWKTSSERLRGLAQSKQIDTAQAEQQIMMWAKQLLSQFNTTLKDTYKLSDQPFTFSDMENIIQIGRDREDSANTILGKASESLKESGESFRNIERRLGGTPKEYEQVDYVKMFADQIATLLQQSNDSFVSGTRNFDGTQVINNTIYNKVVPEYAGFFNQNMQDYDSILNRLNEDKQQLLSNGRDTAKVDQAIQQTESEKKDFSTNAVDLFNYYVENIGKDGRTNIQDFIESYEQDKGRNIASLFSTNQTIAWQVNTLQEAINRANNIRASTKLGSPESFFDLYQWSVAGVASLLAPITKYVFEWWAENIGTIANQLVWWQLFSDEFSRADVGELKNIFFNIDPSQNYTAEKILRAAQQVWPETIESIASILIPWRAISYLEKAGRVATVGAEVLSSAKQIDKILDTIRASGNVSQAIVSSIPTTSKLSNVAQNITTGLARFIVNGPVASWVFEQFNPEGSQWADVILDLMFGALDEAAEIMKSRNLYTRTVDTEKILNSPVFQDQYAKRVFQIDDTAWSDLSDADKLEIREIGSNLLEVARQTWRQLDQEVPGFADNYYRTYKAVTNIPTSQNPVADLSSFKNEKISDLIYQKSTPVPTIDPIVPEIDTKRQQYIDQQITKSGNPTTRWDLLKANPNLQPEIVARWEIMPRVDIDQTIVQGATPTSIAKTEDGMPATYNGNTVIKYGEGNDYIRDSELSDLFNAAAYERQGKNLSKNITPGWYSPTKTYLSKLKNKIKIVGDTPDEIIKNFDTYDQKIVTDIINNFTAENPDLANILKFDADFPVRVLTGDANTDVFLNAFYNFEKILGKPNERISLDVPLVTLEKYKQVLNYLNSIGINPITPGKVDPFKLRNEITALKNAGYYENWTQPEIDLFVDNYFIVKYAIEDYIKEFGNRAVNQFFSSQSLDYVTSAFIFNVLNKGDKNILQSILDQNYGEIFLDFLDSDDRFAKLFLDKDVPLVDMVNRFDLHTAGIDQQMIDQLKQNQLRVALGLPIVNTTPYDKIKSVKGIIKRKMKTDFMQKFDGLDLEDKDYNTVVDILFKSENTDDFVKQIIDARDIPPRLKRYVYEVNKKKQKVVVDTDNPYMKKKSVSNLQNELIKAREELAIKESEYMELIDQWDKTAKVATKGRQVGTETISIEQFVDSMEESTKKSKKTVQIPKYKGWELEEQIILLKKNIDDIQEALQISPNLKWDAKPKRKSPVNIDEAKELRLVHLNSERVLSADNKIQELYEQWLDGYLKILDENIVSPDNINLVSFKQELTKWLITNPERGFDRIVDEAIRKSGFRSLSDVDRESIRQVFGDIMELTEDRKQSLQNYKDRAILIENQDFTTEINNLSGQYKYEPENLLDEWLLKEQQNKLDRDGLIDQNLENKIEVVENTKEVKKYSNNNIVINSNKEERISNRWFQTTIDLLGQNYLKASSTFTRSASLFQVGTVPLYKSIESVLKDPEELAKVLVDMNNIDKVYTTDLAKNVVWFMDFLQENIPELSEVFRNTAYDMQLLENISSVLKSGQNASMFEFVKKIDFPYYKKMLNDQQFFESTWWLKFDQPFAGDIAGSLSKAQLAIKNQAKDTFSSTFPRMFNSLISMGDKLYKFSVFTAVAPLMIINNGVSLATEIFKSWTHWNSKDIANIQRTYGILIDSRTRDSFQGWWFFADILNTIQSAERWSQIFNDILNNWPYNVVENLFAGVYTNNSVSRALEDFWISNKLEFDQYLWTMNDIQKNNFLTELNIRANEVFQQKSGGFFSYKDSKFIYDESGRAVFWEAWVRSIGDVPSRVVGQTYAKLMDTWMYMGTWWTTHVKNMVKHMGSSRNFFGRNMYYQIMEEAGQEAADRYIRQFYTQNMDAIMFFQKILFSLWLGTKIDRVLDQDNSKEFMFEKISDALSFGQLFFAPLQATTSSPVSRSFLMFMQWLFIDVDNNYLDLNNIESGGLMFAQQILRDLWRRFNIPRDVFKATFQPWDYTSNVLSNFWESWQWFLSVLSDEIIRDWFNVPIPQTNQSIVSAIFPNINSVKDAYFESTTERKLALIEELGGSYLQNWFVYSIPFLSDYKMWVFTKWANLQGIVDAMATDPNYEQRFLQGDIPLDGDKDYGEYTYNALIQYSNLSKNTLVEWYDDFRKKYMNKEWIINPYLQNKENLFVNLLLNHLDNNDYNAFINEFSKAWDGRVKQGIQLLGFIEWLAEANGSPGASRELISTIANIEYNEASNRWRSENNYPKDFIKVKLPIEVDKQIKYDIAEKYGDTLFITDKDTYANIWLYYIRKTIGDEYKDFFPEQQPGDSWKQINFKMPWQDSSDNKGTQMFKLDMFAKMQVLSWDANGYAMKNAFDTIWKPTEFQAQNKDYVRVAMKWMNDTIAYIKWTTLPEDTKTHMIAGMISSAIPMAQYMVDDPAFQRENKKVFDTTMAYIYGNVRDGIDVGKEIAYRQLQKWNFKNVQEPTWTLLDQYDQNGNYYSDYLSKWFNSNYSFNKKLLSDVRKFLTKNINIAIKGIKPSAKINNRNYTPSERTYLKSKAKLIYAWSIQNTRARRAIKPAKWEKFVRQKSVKVPKRPAKQLRR